MSSALVGPGARLVDAVSGDVLGGGDLRDAVLDHREVIDALPPGPVFLLLGNTVRDVLRYLAAWTSGRPVCLLDPTVEPDALRRLVEHYRPTAVFGVDGDRECPAGYRLAATGSGDAWRCLVPDTAPVDPRLALLMPTSGSTGNAKLVRLSAPSVLANARAIVDALDIHAGDVALTCLPLSYSFGLSILNSHLVAGATVVVADGGPFTAGFWRTVGQHQVTSLSGVPFTYESLARHGWTAEDHPSLRVLTQAGGRLDPGVVSHFHEQLARHGGRFHVMWGQTEAAPRMTTLHPDDLPAKLGSVGRPLPGTSVSVRTDGDGETTRADVVGELVFRGPNVMLGYAHSRADLGRGDDQGGVLHTGDLGRVDADGVVWLTGRLGREVKVAGTRINLDDVEGLLSTWSPVAAVWRAGRIEVFTERPQDVRPIARHLGERLRAYRSMLAVHHVTRIPRRANHKVDYPALVGHAR